METSLITPHGAVTLRAATAEDAPAYRDVRLEALRDNPQAYSSDYATSLAQPPSFWVERLRPANADRAAITYLALHEQQLIGMGGVVRASSPKAQHSADLVGMYVRPDWRGLHLAQALAEACLDWARAQGIVIVKLAVVTTNARAIRCYARCGFRVYGIEPQALRYDGVYYDELLMARTL